MSDRTPSRNRNRLSVLSLEISARPDEPGRFEVVVRVDGELPFAAVAKEWQGFPPGDMLGFEQPLMPDDLGRRVAVHQCSCGIAGCGVIAPVIVPSPDGTRVSWVDFRDYTGVFDGPLCADIGRFEGRLWDLPDLHFDRAQYVAEVRRATRDHARTTQRARPVPPRG